MKEQTAGIETVYSRGYTSSSWTPMEDPEEQRRLIAEMRAEPGVQLVKHWVGGRVHMVYGPIRREK